MSGLPSNRPARMSANSSVHTADGHAKPSECIKCGKCERECPQGLPIRQLLTEVAAEFEG